MLKLMYGKEVINKKKLGEEYNIYDQASQIASKALVFNDDLIHLTAIKNMENYAR